MRRFPATINRAVTIGGVLWSASIVFFVSQAIVQAASVSSYSIATNLISDLGNTACGREICSPWHTFMNATFVFVGLCHCFGSIATRQSWPHTSGTFGVGVLALAGAGLIVAGLAPENVNVEAHSVGALVGLVCLNVAVIVLGSVIVNVQRWLGVIAITAGSVGFIGLGLFLNQARPVPLGGGADCRLPGHRHGCGVRGLFARLGPTGRKHPGHITPRPTRGLPI